MKRLIAVPTAALLCLAGSSAFALQVLNYFHPSGLPGVVSDARVRPAGSVAPAAGLRSPDIDLKLMASWALRHLNLNPRPELNYEPVFFIRPMQVPPAPAGHDAIVPGDTDCRMDWEFAFMREITGARAASVVERGLHRRVLGYLKDDGLAWVTPGHYMEGAVYQGKDVGEAKVASTWASAKILRSLAESYRREKNEQTRALARKIFLALRKLAEWDSGRAYYPGGSGAWLDGKWVKPQVPTAAVEPIVTYWEATGDPEALQFARAVSDGLLADAELLPKAGARILPTGEFHGHMHSTLHGVWGVAHLGAVTGDVRYLDWARKVYDYASGFGTGTGWISAALWSDSVRELSETCATSDMVSIAGWLARAGMPEHWDHLERTLRNYLQPQQFFVTSEYEALYRKLNADKATAEVEAGLARMRELQGAFMGGPAPNDWINWIGSAKQCGPYNTPYGCMGMFGCCIPEGMRALYTIWSSTITTDKEGVLVNMSLNRDSEWATVVSSLPETGRIDVSVKRSANFFLRPPSWAPRSGVKVSKSGREISPEWGGPGRQYIRVTGAKPGDVLTLVYPLVTYTQVVGNWPTQPKLKLTTRWNGNSVSDMEPRGKGLPVEFSKPSRTPPLTVN